nr:hypothetical protein [uncultured Roseibium sp.]
MQNVIKTCEVLSARVAAHAEVWYDHSMKVYLTGPITGSTDDAILSWREKARELISCDADVIDPASLPYNSSLSYRLSEGPQEALARQMHGRLVVNRNKRLIGSADVILANFLSADHSSIGSIGELFWADALQVPIVIVREPVGNVHDHAMINALASSITHTLNDGCVAVLNILGKNANDIAQA